AERWRRPAPGNGAPGQQRKERVGMVDTTYERLRDIIVEHLGVEKEKVTPDASFTDDLNADSLDLVDLMMTIEERFGLAEIPDEDTRKIVTVQDTVDYIEEHAS